MSANGKTNSGEDSLQQGNSNSVMETTVELSQHCRIERVGLKHISGNTPLGVGRWLGHRVRAQGTSCFRIGPCLLHLSSYQILGKSVNFSGLPQFFICKVRVKMFYLPAVTSGHIGQQDISQVVMTFQAVCWRKDSQCSLISRGKVAI